VRLPLAAAPPDVEVAPSRSSPRGACRSWRWRTTRTPRFALGEVLALLGHHAEVARSGPEAIAMVRKCGRTSSCATSGFRA
jgi:hypothetical protein